MTNASNGSDTIISLLARNAKSYPDQVAMREKDLGIWQSYTWREYLDEVLALAAGFEGLGFKEKDAMLVLGDNKSQMYFGILGVSSLRGYPTPVFPDSTPEEILHLARDCGARFALADDQEQVDKLLDLREQLGHLDYIIYRDSRGMGTYTDEGLIAYDEIREKGAARLKAEPGLDQSIIGRTTPDDETIFLHSSGTTGKPKSILLKHRHMLFSMRAAREGKVFEEGEETLAYLPMAWVGDFAYTVAGGIVLRFTVNIPESQETVMHDLCETAPTMIFAPPRMWENMLTSVQVRMESSTPLKRWLFNRYIQLAMDMERDKLEGRSATWWQQVQKRLGEFFVYGSVKDQMGLSRVKRAFTGGEAMGEETFLFYRAIGVNLKQGYGLTEA
ncbi:MAG: AMP-binding protein, partial [Proteobacteria bacterium]|nr:AMP-binding protein [Pseudomonadota bacterium]